MTAAATNGIALTDADAES